MNRRNTEKFILNWMLIIFMVFAGGAPAIGGTATPAARTGVSPATRKVAGFEAIPVVAIFLVIYVIGIGKKGLI
jgi:hypothetical protein